MINRTATILSLGSLIIAACVGQGGERVVQFSEEQMNLLRTSAHFLVINPNSEVFMEELAKLGLSAQVTSGGLEMSGYTSIDEFLTLLPAGKVNADEVQISISPDLRVVEATQSILDAMGAKYTCTDAILNYNAVYKCVLSGVNE